MPHAAEAGGSCKSLQALILRGTSRSLCPLTHRYCCDYTATCGAGPTLCVRDSPRWGLYVAAYPSGLGTVQTTAGTVLRRSNRCSRVRRQASSEDPWLLQGEPGSLERP